MWQRRNVKEYGVEFDPQNAGEDVTLGKELHFKVFFYNATTNLSAYKARTHKYTLSS